MKYIKLFLKQLALILSLAALTSCSQPQDKEAQIIDLVKSVKTSFQKHHGKNLKNIISEDYLDIKGRQKKEIEGLITFYLLRHKNIHLLTHILKIDFHSENRCIVTLYAAMAGSSGKFKELPGSLQTDVYKFNFTLQLTKGDWLLLSSEWERVSTNDISLLIESLKD